MKYLSIDTETTGLNPDTCEILSFAAVVEDTDKPQIPVEELPYVHYIFNKRIITGEPYALNMNRELIKTITEGVDRRLIDEASFVDKFSAFVAGNGLSVTKIKVAGKNFSAFDQRFINRLLIKRGHSNITFSHRTLDPSPLFINFKEDEWLPGLDECKIRSDVSGPVSHDALEDARDIIRVLRTKY